MMLAVFAIFFFASDILHNIIYKKYCAQKIAQPYQRKLWIEKKRKNISMLIKIQI